MKLEKHVTHHSSETLGQVLAHADRLGVTDAVIVSPGLIPVDATFVNYCKEPGCPGYGMAMSCPPNVEGPEWFSDFKKGFEAVLVFKFDVPSPVLLTDERHDVTRLIHETAAGIELYAKSLGLERARGFAGGSCRILFCSAKPDCRVLSGRGTCRNPEKARQSMSGMGVDFLELTRRLGWSASKITRCTDPVQDPMGTMAGMVFLE